MPKRVIPLTLLQVKNAKPKDKPYKLFDGGGLYLEVTTGGSKRWHLKYRQLNGAENRLSFGLYPDASLAEARDKRASARKLLAENIDPGTVRDAQTRAARKTAEDTFEKVARLWHATMIETWQPQTAKNVLQRFEADIFPVIGKDPIAQVKRDELLAAVRAIERRGAREIARRLTSDCSRVFNFAIDSGLATVNPAIRLANVLLPREGGHFPAIDSDSLPAFLRALYANEACLEVATRIAMRLMLLTFVRTSELIENPWGEVDLDKHEWIIPWQRMKRGKRKVKPDKRDHDVCAPRQVFVLMRELHAHTGGGTLLFPNIRDGARPMSNMALLKAIERMGYKGDMTGHGFRALAMSTLKERLHFRHEVVDRQLSHARKDELEEAYDRARYLRERRFMMQQWADYLDELGRIGVLGSGDVQGLDDKFSFKGIPESFLASGGR